MTTLPQTVAVVIASTAKLLADGFMYHAANSASPHSRARSWVAKNRGFLVSYRNLMLSTNTLFTNKPAFAHRTSLVDRSGVRHEPGQAVRPRCSCQLQPRVACTVSRQLVFSPPTACHVPSASSFTLGSHKCEVVPNSGSMEKGGLIRFLAFAREKELTVRSLATDRHRSIAKHMGEKEPAILHFFDVWHVSKSVKKSLNAASKSHDCGSLVVRAQPAVNHMYWCAAASRGNPDLLEGAWSSMTRHVVDVHADHPGMYTKCLHQTIEDGEWPVPDTLSHARFVVVVPSKSLLKDLRQLSPDTQTYGLESFHSVLNRFGPKWADFRTKGMLARIRVAALHWNENGEREQATTKMTTCLLQSPEGDLEHAGLEAARCEVGVFRNALSRRYEETCGEAKASTKRVPTLSLLGDAANRESFPYLK
ncbi:hypothetical protein HPB47_006237 [Ixodes persulcatus]|uniref:Uncharacterized protein n=1 Tax=Ixodes persulcatus TaxID=34615 RepID=A0AC60PBJ6_IXOPE|nr:hypothetical protein HPB47_006237 [Ixodes persulcatus]